MHCRILISNFLPAQLPVPPSINTNMGHIHELSLQKNPPHQNYFSLIFARKADNQVAIVKVFDEPD